MSLTCKFLIALFQSNERNVDFCVFHFFLNDFFLNNDFIGPLGTYDFPFLSGAPRERSNYLSIIKPFDNRVWAWTWGSTVAVTLALLLINVVYSISFEGKEFNWTDEVVESMLYIYQESSKYNNQ